MATFKICVFDHQKREDGKYPVSIRVYWNKRSSYIHTSIYVSGNQISKKSFFNSKGEKKITVTLKDPFVIKEMNSRITLYEDIKVKKLGLNIEQYTSKELAAYLVRESLPGTDSTIDFIKFARLHCSRLVAKGKKSTAARMTQTINMIIDFRDGRENISIAEINVKFLNAFNEYLRSERSMSRKNQLGKIVTIKRKGLSDVSVSDYMTDIRTLFNAAIEEHNDEDRDEIRIKHYPFRKFKLKKGPEPDKRALKTEQIVSIRDISDQILIQKRAILARDVFMLSFYLAGMNTADIYDVKKSTYKNGRLTYCRQKTRDRRQDKALISIIVPAEALPYFEKYRDRNGSRVFCFANMYSTYRTFNSNVNKGLKHVADMCEIEEELTTYFARFSIATIARNNCGVSKDDIDLLLGHVEPKQKMVDKYVKKDWSLVDNALRKVIDHLNMVPLPVSNQTADTP